MTFNGSEFDNTRKLTFTVMWNPCVSFWHVDEHRKKKLVWQVINHHCVTTTMAESAFATLDTHEYEYSSWSRQPYCSIAWPRFIISTLNDNLIFHFLPFIHSFTVTWKRIYIQIEMKWWQSIKWEILYVLKFERNSTQNHCIYINIQYFTPMDFEHASKWLC